MNIKTTAILAMSVDGKIASNSTKAARFTSKADLTHLESQMALNDVIIFGAATLRAYQTTLSISNPQLLEARLKRKQTIQPLQIVCSSSGKLDINWRFFSQPIPKGLLTTQKGAQFWLNLKSNPFEKIIISENQDNFQINWQNTFEQLSKFGYQKIAILGGGKLVASLLAENLIQELWLTISATIIGGKNAPTLVEGEGLFPFKKLQLLEVKTIEDEIFLHYLIIN